MKNNYNEDRVAKLLQYTLALAGQKDEYWDRFLKPIHLIKYVYLVDLEHAKQNNGQTYTGLPWRFYKFGPWCEEIYTAVDSALTEIGAEKREGYSDKFEKDYIQWQISEDSLLNQLEEELDLSIKATLQKYIRQFGSDTEGLLHFVYNTVPMLIAAPNETLDFTKPFELKKAHSSSETLISNEPEILTDRQRKKRKQKIEAFKKKMQTKGKVTPRKITPKEPRYDDIYFQGLQWLDSLEGEPLQPGHGEITVDPAVWKSKSRFDPEGADDDIS
ncbi:MAG: DUF4065 domain-containing protein [Thermodesulfobacteriota bacterium]|nr:DUF4065 domain-containing protein [Thermodesulfobacteriota bacterium]